MSRHRERRSLTASTRRPTGPGRVALVRNAAGASWVISIRDGRVPSRASRADRRSGDPEGRRGRADTIGAMTTDQSVAIVGLGYVGLPLAIAFVEAGLTVEGIDAHHPRVAE